VSAKFSPMKGARPVPSDNPITNNEGCHEQALPAACIPRQSTLKVTLARAA
jgi:hypothetical protein